MKTFTESEFRDQLQRADWIREDIIERSSRESTTVEKMFYSDVYGCVHKEVEVIDDVMYRRSTLDGLIVEYWNTVTYEEFEPDSLEFDNSSYPDTVWDVSGFQVTDESGDALDCSQVEEILDEYDDFKDIDASELLEEIDETIQIDVSEDSQMETTQIEVTNEPNIEFTGEELAKVDNRIKLGGGYAIQYSELTLYKTQAGRYICHQCDTDRMGGETYLHTASVADDHSGVIEFFGHGDLAKELYCKADLEDKIVIE